MEKVYGWISCEVGLRALFLSKQIYKALIRRVNFQCSETMQKKTAKSFRKPSVPFFATERVNIAIRPVRNDIFMLSAKRQSPFRYFPFFSIHPSPFFFAGARVLSLRPFFSADSSFRIRPLFYFIFYFVLFVYTRKANKNVYVTYIFLRWPHSARLGLRTTY